MLKHGWAIGFCGLLVSGMAMAEDPASPFGAHNRSGASVLMTESKAIEAANLIRRGRVVPLGRAYTQEMPLFPGQTFSHTGTDGPARQTADTVIVEGMLSGTLGHVGTHLSGLSHMGQIGEVEHFYNGAKVTDIYRESGALPLDITTVKPFFTRGLLIDMVTLRGGPMEAGDEITLKDMEIALVWQGLKAPAAGDVVLFHTGWGRHWGNGAEAYHNGSPGIGQELAAWLAERNVALIGADSWSVAVQQPGDAPHYPVHLFLLKENGIFLQQNMETERIIDAEISEFAYIFAPLRVSGATGSPGTPLAVY